MRQLRGRSVGLAVALALGTMVIAGCGGHKAASNTPAPAGTTAPASQPSSAPASSSGGGYGY
jgi:hypothetical protein